MKASEILRQVINESISSISTSCEGEEILQNLIRRYGDAVRQEAIEEFKKESEK